MTARSQMKMRADFERDLGGLKDTWNQAPAVSWQPHLTAQPCLAWTKAKKEVEGGGTNVKVAVVEDMRINVPLGMDVTSKDRVLNIEDRKGTILFTGPFSVDTVQIRRTHLELLISKSGE